MCQMPARRTHQAHFYFIFFLHLTLSSKKPIHHSYRNNGLEAASYISENSPCRPMSSLGQLFSQINLKNRKKISPTRFSVGSEPI